MENYPGDISGLGGVTAEWEQEYPTRIVNGELVVPPNEYFMMGDNRDNSSDSRFWGFVPRANVIATPLMIYMSIDAPDEVSGPGFVVDRFETYASVFIHPSKVRSKRLFHTFEIHQPDNPLFRNEHPSCASPMPASTFLPPMKPARIAAMARRTFRRGVLAPIGGFGSHFHLDRERSRDPVLVSSTDGSARS